MTRATDVSTMLPDRGRGPGLAPGTEPTAGQDIEPLHHGARREIEIPAHIEQVLATIRTRFAVPKGEIPLDRRDTLAYAKVLAVLTPVQARRVEQLLRERHVYRPMVAEVRAAVDEVRGADKALEAADLRARQIVRTPPRPKALPAGTSGPGRQEFRGVLELMRRGMRP